MARNYTIMIVPEDNKKIKSYKIPKLIFKSVTVIIIGLSVMMSIFLYDYWSILQEIHKNKHLTIENRQLKEQFQLFQMKLNSLTHDIKRIHIFERKLKIITGIENVDMTVPLKTNFNEDEKKNKDNSTIDDSTGKKIDQLNTNNFFENKKYLELKDLYEKRIAVSFGVDKHIDYVSNWDTLINQSIRQATTYAAFDYRYNELKSIIAILEFNVNSLDQVILDKKSFLNSTPTLLPTRGWITSFYGPRISPTSGQRRMHEGVDIGAKSGTPILASADGVIAYAGIKPGFGYFVHIDHGYGIESFYAHAKKIFIKKGDVVKRGNKIAAIGNTGSSTGPHVHYEIRVNGTPVDPLYFVLN